MPTSCNPAVCDLHSDTPAVRPLNYRIYNIWGKMNFYNFRCNLFVDFRIWNVWAGGRAELWTDRLWLLIPLPLRSDVRTCFIETAVYRAVLLAQTLARGFCAFVASVALCPAPLKWFNYTENQVRLKNGLFGYAQGGVRGPGPSVLSDSSLHLIKHFQALYPTWAVVNQSALTISGTLSRWRGS